MSRNSQKTEEMMKKIQVLNDKIDGLEKKYDDVFNKYKDIRIDNNRLVLNECISDTADFNIITTYKENNTYYNILIVSGLLYLFMGW